MHAIAHVTEGPNVDVYLAVFLCLVVVPAYRLFMLPGAETTGSQDEMPLNSSRSLAEGNSGMRCEVKNLMFFFTPTPHGFHDATPFFLQSLDLAVNFSARL